MKQIELTNLDTLSKNSKKEQPLDYDPTNVQTLNLTNNVANFRVGR